MRLPVWKASMYATGAESEKLISVSRLCARRNANRTKIFREPVISFSTKTPHRRQTC